MKWFAPQRPYLIEEAAIAPDITGSGVLAIVKGLRSCPLDWNLPSVWHVVVIILKASGQSKISKLKTQYHTYNSISKIQTTKYNVIIASIRCMHADHNVQGWTKQILGGGNTCETRHEILYSWQWHHHYFSSLWFNPGLYSLQRSLVGWC